MKNSSETQRRERLLLKAWLLSMWAPLGTGVAFYFNPSATQLADALRRTSELIGVFLAWWAARKISSPKGTYPEEAKERLESMVGLALGTVMMVSAATILYTAVRHLITPEPTGWIVPGVLVATGGAVVNGWFWRTGKGLSQDSSTLIIESHWRLYRAKTLLDLCVLATLAASHLLREVPWSTYIDPLGSLVLVGFLLYSGITVGARAWKNL